MDLLQICVVKSLEKCQESTPANLVESMFKFVRKETPCVNMTSVSHQVQTLNRIYFYKHFISNISNFCVNFQTVFSKQASLKGNANDAPSSTISSVLFASCMALFAMRMAA